MSALRQPTPPTDAPTVAALPATPRVVLDAIRGAYSFADATDEASVFRILEKRPDVAAVLLEALPHMRNIFGAGTHAMLLSVDDHTDASSSLSARIVSTESVPKARAKRDAFYRSFWLGVPGEIDEVLSFGLIWPHTT